MKVLLIQDKSNLFATSFAYPVLVRPSYVLGGQGMQIATDKKLKNSWKSSTESHRSSYFSR